MIIATVDGQDELRPTHTEAKVSVRSRERPDPAAIERVYADHYRDVFQRSLLYSEAVALANLYAVELGALWPQQWEQAHDG